MFDEEAKASMLAEQFSISQDLAQQHLNECGGNIGQAGQQLLSTLQPCVNTPTRWQKKKGANSK